MQSKKLIKSWEDLARVEASDKYHLDINPKNGNGGMMNKETGKSERY